MSNLSAILLMLATLGLMLIGLVLALRMAHQRCDEVASGVVNGVAVSRQYRWLLLFYDYVGMGFGTGFLLAIFAVGFLAAAEVVGDPSVRNVAYFCAAGSAWLVLGQLVFVSAWVVYLASVLRQAKQS
jgi:hypothetical protein